MTKTRKLSPEARRHLALSNYHSYRNDWTKALHYSLLPASTGIPEGVINRINCLMFTRRYDAAVEFASNALVNAVDAKYRGVLLGASFPALSYLSAREGDMSPAYSALFHMSIEESINPGMKRWNGESLQGKSLLVTLSQSGLGGLGDNIMWARFLPLLAAKGCRIAIQMPKPLQRLFSILPGVFSVCDYEDSPPCDYATSMIEIAHLLGLKHIPQGLPFNIKPLPMPGDTHNIGINWGASWVAQHMDRTCALAEYLPIQQIADVKLYSLQKGPHSRQLYPAPVGMDVFDIGPRLHDFLDTANMLMSLDAVVTTDNVVANLSCMLGRPTFVLVPKIADFRWGEGGVSPWYPTARVYHQDTNLDWSAPIARLKDDLSAFLSSTKDLEAVPC
jgi:hypothetical protein